MAVQRGIAQGDARKFKVGDLVTTNYLAKQSRLWEDLIEGQVALIDGLSVQVLFLDWRDDPSMNGTLWWIEARYMKKVVVTKKAVDEAIKSIMQRVS